MNSSAASGDLSGKAISANGGWMPQRAVCEFFGVSVMSLWRWERDKKMAFPRSVEINGRRYFQRDEIVNYRPPETPQSKRRPPYKTKKTDVSRENV
jgi:predicted DNA-binding transcriptional regulator AlpA